MTDTSPKPAPAVSCTLNLETGAVLFRRGEPARSLMHLLQGRVMIGTLSRGALEHQLAVYQGPFWLEASAGLLGQEHIVDAIAQSHVQVQLVALDTLMKDLGPLPTTVYTLMMDMARAQRQQTEVALSRLAKDADARCAEWLLRHARPAHEKGGLAVTLQEHKRTIAAQLGIAPETFSRVLRQLRERKLISGAGRVMELLNPKALRELAGV